MKAPMTARPTPPRTSSTPDDEDLPLLTALRGLPAPGDAARLGALQARVLSQWQASHGAQAPGLAATLGAGPAGRWLLFGGARRRWLLGSGMAVCGAALALGVWLRQPDPVLEELLQPDVLSQMAIGEM